MAKNKKWSGHGRTTGFHNGSGTLKMYETNDTNLLVKNAYPNLFVFMVAAFNVLGTGEERDFISGLHTYYNTILFIYRCLKE